MNSQSTETQKREIQSYSATLYKISMAIYVTETDSSTLRSQIISEISRKCLKENQKIIINGKESQYSWGKVPDYVKNGGSCKAELSGEDDFKITVIGNVATNNFTSVNGN